MDAHQIESRVAGVLRRHVEPGQRLTVGLSGGLDSVVLLHLLKQLAGALDFRLAAHHVNHQISPNAPAWVDFCANICQAWDVPFATTAVDVPRKASDGLEAAARHERYRVLDGLDADFIVLAHHQDDQAETFLLQLFRGAGVLGLSSMPEARVGQRRCRPASSSPVYLRPLLDVPRSSIKDYALKHGLRWVEDESNADRKFTRNFIRHEIFPLLNKRFPAGVANVAQAAAHCAEASQLLDELAGLDAETGLRDGRLDVAALDRLSPARAKNLLRFFLRSHGLPMPDQGRLQEMLRQLCTARADRQLRLLHGGLELRRFRNQIYAVRPVAARKQQADFRWHGETEIMFPELGGRLCFVPQVGMGVDAGQLRDKRLSLRCRSGGERLKLGRNRPTRSLKNLLQESAMPPWGREHLPLLYVDNRLAWVADVGLDVEFQTPQGEPGVLLKWESNG